MKKFIINVFVVFLSVLIVDVFIGYIGRFIIEKLNEESHSGQTALLSYSICNVDADIVVLGSSTANCHIMPKVLADSINAFSGHSYTAFNTGAYYQQPSYSYAVLKSMLERKAPKIAICDIQPEHLGGPANEEALKALRPFYRMNKNVKNVLDENEQPRNRFLLNFNMYQFNTEIIKFLRDFATPERNDGFYAKEGVYGGEWDMKKRKDTNLINQTISSEFEKMLKLANDNNVKLFICFSPRLVYTDREGESYKKIISLCEKYNVPVMDFTVDAEFQNNKYFHDKLHLNPVGAYLLTKKIIDIINDKS